MAEPRNQHFDIAEVLARTDLRELLDQYAEPTTTAWGRRWHCPVPDHPDSRASVTMHVDGRGHERWRCWSGDDTHRGDAIDLIQVAHRTDRTMAIEHLAHRSGMHLGQPLPPPRPRRPRASGEPKPLDPAVARYVNACAEYLWHPDMIRVRQWLHARGFTKETLLENRLGADPGRNVMSRRTGLPRGESMAATFPALDRNGQITYVQTRYLQPRPDGPKYENPRQSLGANPRVAWPKITGEVRPGVLVVCEGIPDALVAAQAGFAAAGILGSQAPDATVAATLIDHAQQKRITIAGIVDADPAGRRWGERLGELIADAGHSIELIEPPDDGVDLNDWALADPNWADWVTPTAVAELRVTMPFDQVHRSGVEMPSR